MPALLGLAALLWCALPGAAEAQQYRSLLGQGWTYIEAGNYRKAELAFKEAFATQEGKNAAEVYYAIAALWWERRNAMASYMWLSDAEKAARNSFNWDGGPEGEWDQRIEQRRTYIQRNFGAVRLRSPSRGAPLPPLVDPLPADPLLKDFTDNLPRVVAEGIAEKVAVQWVLLPAGDYWVGDEIQALDAGMLDAAKAPAWELSRDNAKGRRAYEQRVTDIAAGKSPANEARGAQADALAAEDAAAKVAADRAAAEKTAAEAERVAAAKAQVAAQAAVDAQAKADAAVRLKADADRKARAQADAAAQREADAAAKAQADARAAADVLASAQKAKEDAAANVEAERVAALSTKAKVEREAAELAAERGEAERARIEGERKADEWQQAQARMRAEQEREKEAGRLRREQLREKRSSGGGPSDDVFATRRLALSTAAGGATVTRLGAADASTVGMDWSAQFRVDYVAPIEGATVALPIGISWTNLPVSGCSHRQTRANTLSLHVGPRFATPIKGRLWLAGQIGAHIGGGASFPTADAISQCATESLKPESDGVAYGARLKSADGATGRLSLGDLGWTGWAMLFGPDGDIGILGAPGAGPTYLGVSFFMRYDQVVPIIRGTAYHFQAEGSSSPELSSVLLETVSSQASMARFQFGLRGRILF